MIQVQFQPEYSEFNATVRQRGWRYLQKNPNPSGRDLQKHNYWKKAKLPLLHAYLYCAYTSRRVEGDDVSVDHYWPKAKYPQLAYEWGNYRLASAKLNRNKGDSEAVVDPFRVRPGWFVLDCPSGLIYPGDNLAGSTLRKVSASISVLALNSDELVAERYSWLADWSRGLIPFKRLRWEYPYLAFEIERQGLKVNRKPFAF